MLVKLMFLCPVARGAGVLCARQVDVQLQHARHVQARLRGAPPALLPAGEADAGKALPYM